MIFEDMFQTLWNLALGLIEIIGDVWDWLSKPIEINIPLLSDIPLIGGWFNMTLEYSPIEFLSVGILVLIVLWIVKGLIPLG